MVDKVVRDGNVAVLYSPGYGAGWSTWERIPGIEFDPVLVKWVEDGKPDLGDRNVYRADNYTHGVPEWLAEYLKDKYDIEFLGGVPDLEIKWIPEGTRFYISEYDGSEHVEYSDSKDWSIA
jgi:hypothetical protein